MHVLQGTAHYQLRLASAHTRPAPPPAPPQIFATSKDGTRVPMFVTHRKGIDLNGANPALLYGYGAAARARPPAGA